MFLIGDLGNTHSKFTLCNLKSKKIKNYKSFNTNNILTNKNFIKFISKHKIIFQLDRFSILIGHLGKYIYFIE